MKKYKVESVFVEKKFLSIVITAENRESAIKHARTIEHGDFDITETSVAHEWDARTEWSFWSMIKSLFGGRH